MMLTKTIPAYVYQQYADDSDIQAFFRAYNDLAQQYVDFFNTINLPNYVGNNQIAGQLLDWVARGLYGMTRPVLAAPHTPLGSVANVGSFNSFTFNTIRFNRFYSKTTNPIVYYMVNDDVFKRILTWHFYKGDGKVFNVRWLKRRINRFMNGAYGTSPSVSATLYTATLAPISGTTNGSNTQFSLLGQNGETINNYAGNPLIYKTDWQGQQLQYSTPRTNLCPNSQTLQNWSQFTGASVTANAAVAPDGTMTAARVIFNGTPGGQIVQVVSGLTIGQQYPFSIWVQSDGTVQQPQQLYVQGVGAIATFTPSANWTRVYGTFIAALSSPAMIVVNTPTSASSFYAWGAQIETGTAPTSYIPTTVVPVTVTDYAISHPGKVTFAIAPAVGSTLSWTGQYYLGGVIDYSISVTFPYEGTVVIRLGGANVTTHGGTFNSLPFNKRVFNSLKFTTAIYPTNSMAAVFQSAVNAGVIELPFQYVFIV